MLNESNGKKISLTNLFKIYLRTGRKRILLTLISGIIILILLISVSMIAYNYRYRVFSDYMGERANWFQDGKISVKSTNFRTGNLTFANNFLTNFTKDFTNLVKNYVPNIGYYNLSSVLSTQIYRFNPYAQDEFEMFISQELMTVDDRTYNVFNKTLIEGRLPQNASELLIMEKSEPQYFVNDTITIYPFGNLFYGVNFTVVGVLTINEEIFKQYNVSSDLFNWEFYGYSSRFYSYFRENVFLTDYSSFKEIFDVFDVYSGFVFYGVDIDYNVENVRINKIDEYINGMPKITSLAISKVIENYIVLADDLKFSLMDFVDFWVNQLIRVLSINIPLMFIFCLICIMVLNIGSEKLDSTYRKMKLHGLNYRNIRKLIFFENSLMSITNFVIGSSLGIGISYLLMLGKKSSSVNYFIDFLREPLLLMLFITFFVGFFIISFYIHNTIAKKATLTISEEYSSKRRILRNLFSTNEFRLFVVALFFTLISVVFYYVYKTLETEIPILSNINAITFLWFLITCSGLFLFSFLLLLFARLISYFWSLISKFAAMKNVNLTILVLKQLNFSKKKYQITILVALIFGLFVLPSALINSQINNHLKDETALNMGTSSLTIFNWIDPNDERDSILESIEEIVNFTEVTVYNARLENEELQYENGYRLYLVGIEDPAKFISLTNPDMVSKIDWENQDILDLENQGSILLDKKTAKRLKVESGDQLYNSDFTRGSIILDVVNTFDYFPFAPLPRKYFYSSYEACTMIGTKATMKEISNELYYDTYVYSQSYKILIPKNDSVIPIIKEKLLEHHIKNVYTYEELFDKLYEETNQFNKDNIIFYSYFIFLTITIIGFFTGIKVYQEKIHIVESLYRSGSSKLLIFGLFIWENCIVNLIPVLLTMLLSIPFTKIIADLLLDIQVTFIPFNVAIPFWVFILFLLAGIASSSVGYTIAIAPMIRNYKPIKQE